MSSIRNNERRWRRRVVRWMLIREIPEHDASVARTGRCALPSRVERKCGDVAVVLVRVVNGLLFTQIPFDERAIPAGGEETAIVDERTAGDPSSMLAKVNGRH